MVNRLLFFFFLFSFFFFKIKAQIGFDIFHDFCPDTSVTSATFSCFADSDRFFVYGKTQTDGISNEHGFIACFDYNKNLLWSKNLYFPGKKNGVTSPKIMARISNERYVLAAIVLDTDIKPPMIIYQPFLYFFDRNGDSLNYTISIDTVGHSYKSLAYHNGILSIAGLVQTPDYQTWGMELSKFDTTGNLLSRKKYQAPQKGVLEIDKILLSGDGQHYFVTGGGDDTTYGRHGSVITKLDTSGNLIWIRPLPKRYYSEPYMDIVPASAGGYYFLSSYSLNELFGVPPVYSILYYGKINEEGDTVWTKKYNDNYGGLVGRQIEWSADKTHLLLFAKQRGDLTVLIKTDTNGNFLWERRIQPHYNFYDWYNVYSNQLYCLSVAPDDRYLLSGFAYCDSGLVSWITLTDKDGCRYPNDPACWPLSVNSTENSTPEVKIYPNPVTDKFIIEKAATGTTLQIFDIIGRQVYNGIITSAKHEIDLSRLNRGNYIVQLKTAESKLVRKILKE